MNELVDRVNRVLEENHSPFIKPIETLYKGYRFRSRLEARWAVFFDTVGIEYRYEPEGFEKGSGTDVVRYLPDFYLPGSQTWVEVKGSNEQFKRDADRMEQFLDWGCPLPGFDDSDGGQATLGRGLLILGEIPEPKWSVVFHPIIRHHKGLVWRFARFGKGYCPVVVESNFHVLLMFFADEEPKEWTTDIVQIETPRAIKVVIDAYGAARSARFEHGEHP